MCVCLMCVTFLNVFNIFKMLKNLSIFKKDTKRKTKPRYNTH
ncbi:hypothetical protein HMPREF1401_00644 [Helicobacter pylori GAM120Ai]|uniref:Uncharacterized protein n=1 Tax=Helicobacter pylori GAM120Ai TaxID=1159029 RepID=A0AAV3IG61_HELPX|nr:hypothetical protein HMPREF1401_00644 [Helicobacter pylori GAM120Ai]